MRKRLASGTRDAALPQSDASRPSRVPDAKGGQGTGSWEEGARNASNDNMSPAVRRRLLRRRVFAPLMVVVILIGWFAYLWFVSGVVTTAEHYPDGKIKAEGYVKRVGWNDYRRHGAWTTYHPDGKMES